jgi:hypothetical protein
MMGNWRCDTGHGESKQGSFRMGWCAATVEARTQAWDAREWMWSQPHGLTPGDFRGPRSGASLAAVFTALWTTVEEIRTSCHERHGPNEETVGGVHARRQAGHSFAVGLWRRFLVLDDTERSQLMGGFIASRASHTRALVRVPRRGFLNGQELPAYHPWLSPGPLARRPALLGAVTGKGVEIGITFLGEGDDREIDGRPEKAGPGSSQLTSGQTTAGSRHKVSSQFLMQDLAIREEASPTAAHFVVRWQLPRQKAGGAKPALTVSQRCVDGSRCSWECRAS